MAAAAASSSLVHAVRVAAGPVRLGHAVRGRLRPFSFVPGQALAVRGERRRALREAPRAGGGVLRREKRDAFTPYVFGRCDRTATSFCMPAAVKQSKNFCEGFSQPLGARGKPSGRVSSAALEAISNRSSTLANGTDNGVSTIAGTHPQRYHIQRSVPATLVRVCSITFARSRCGFPPRHLV